MTEKSQREAILRELKLGWSVSPMRALNRFGCLRLAARIWELRQQGHNIETEQVAVHKGKRVAVYRLVRK